MRKILIMLAITLLFIIDVKPLPAMAITDASINKVILNDTINDFQLFSDLLTKVQDFNRTEAIDRLSMGFECNLAAALADFYFQSYPDSNNMAVVCTDSIPVITEADRPFCRITRLNDHRARLHRIYANCYSTNDRWLYQVTLEKSEHWKIVDLNLVPVYRPVSPLIPSACPVSPPGTF